MFFRNITDAMLLNCKTVPCTSGPPDLLLVYMMPREARVKTPQSFLFRTCVIVYTLFTCIFMNIYTYEYMHTYIIVTITEAIYVHYSEAITIHRRIARHVFQLRLTHVIRDNTGCALRGRTFRTQTMHHTLYHEHCISLQTCLQSRR